MSRRHGEPVWILRAPAEQQHMYIQTHRNALPAILRRTILRVDATTAAWSDKVWRWSERAEDLWGRCDLEVIQPANQKLIKPVSPCCDSSRNLSLIPERNITYLFFFLIAVKNLIFSLHDFYLFNYFFAKLKSHSSPRADVCNPSTHMMARLEIPRHRLAPGVTPVLHSSCLREEEKASAEQLYCLLTSHSQSK